MKNFILFVLTFVSLAIRAQDIKVYFNQSVNNSISIYTDAQTSAHLDDTICKLIDMANNTLDIAVWDNGNDQIVACINDAYDRGVQVRYITSSNAINSALSGLNPGIPVLERNAGLTSNVMHNKFIIVDDNYVLTGSMNFGDGAIFDDYNNIVLLHDASIALTYTIEFNEMWGSTGASYNLTNSKFGPDKSDNTPHVMVIGGVEVESYFSPTDQTTAQIIQEIDSAEYTLDIAMFTFLNNDISDAVIAAHNRGVIVRCIIENVGYFGSEYNNLLDAGITVLSHDGVQYDFHHKYCIIDAKHGDSNPTFITGSHNWTNSAEEEYDENTLIIHDPLLCWQFLEEFGKRWTELGGVLEIQQENNLSVFTLFPNPSNDNFTIETNTDENFSYEIFSMDGKLISVKQNGTAGIVIAHNLTAGIYLIKIYTHTNTQELQLIIE
jgi:phosphatidylserine/phosphatidylglycerophosphate/cardiolipin synthase-like enzyme